MKQGRKGLGRHQGILSDAQTLEVQVQRWPRHSDNQLVLVAQGPSPIRLSHDKDQHHGSFCRASGLAFVPKKVTKSPQR